VSNRHLKAKITKRPVRLRCPTIITIRI